MRRIILSIILLSVSALSFGAESLWNKANTAYSDGKYSEALQSYMLIESGEGVSAALYYNIGNCYFKDNNIAKAILYYNRAERLSPNNKDIKHNLSVANNLTLNRISETPDFFVVRWLKAVANISSTNGWAVFSIIAFAFAMGMVVLFFRSKLPLHRKLSFSFGVAALIVTFTSITASAYQKGVINNKSEAIIMQGSTAVKSSPDDAGKDLFVLSEGIKVSINETIGKWSEITIASGEKGWIESSNIEII